MKKSNQQTIMNYTASIDFQRRMILALQDFENQHGSTRTITLQDLRNMCDDIIDGLAMDINNAFDSTTLGHERTQSLYGLTDGELAYMYLTFLFVSNHLDVSQKPTKRNGITKDVVDLDIDNQDNNENLPNVPIINHLFRYLNADAKNAIRQQTRYFLPVNPEIQNVVDVAMRNFAQDYGRGNVFVKLYRMEIPCNQDPNFEKGQKYANSTKDSVNKFLNKKKRNPFIVEYHKYDRHNDNDKGGKGGGAGGSCSATVTNLIEMAQDEGIVK